MAQLRVDAACVLLLNNYSHELEHAASHGFRSGEITMTRLRLGEGYAGKAALGRRPIVLRDVTGIRDFARKRLRDEEGFIGYAAAPLVAKGHVKGVLEVFRRQPLEMDEEWVDFLETLARQAAIAVDNAQLFEGLQRSNAELIQAYDVTLEGWARALELRDQETEGHTRRVTETTVELARALGLPDHVVVHLRHGAILHDIGKMAIPDSILRKPGPLTEDEWDIMRRHPVYAYELLSPIPFLRPALDIPYCHHEWWNGEGYPRGLRGEEIPLAARIFAVADVWDALNSDRPYRKAWPRDRALAYIQENAGRQFDPQVVEVFLHLVERDRVAVPKKADGSSQG